MISKAFYKDRPAVKLSKGDIEALFLPEDGAKLASLRIKGKEFMAQNPSKKYLRLGYDTSYVESECSAFDDMFPTIDPCVICGFNYPDHGEVCRSVFDFQIKNDVAKFKCAAKSVNALFFKTVYLDGNAICIKYEIENKNNFDLPYIWAGHIMLEGEEGAIVVSKYNSHDSVTVAFGNPHVMEKAHMLEKYGANKEYKFYYDEAKIPLECSVCYPKTCRKINFFFDGDAVKYLGIWMNPGDLNGMYNLAIEPCTAPYDTPIKATAKGKGSIIPPGAKVEFVLRIKGE